MTCRVVRRSLCGVALRTGGSKKKFEIKNGRLLSFDDENEEVKEIIIPDGVTYISQNLFKEYTSLETVIMPDSVVSIGSGAFFESPALKNIRFSKNLRFIGEYAFDDTKWFYEQTDDFVIINSNILYRYLGHEKEVVIPENIEYISPCAFSENKSVESIIMSDNVIEIGDNAFAYCSGLKKIRLSEKLKIINDELFSNCYSLKEITFPDSITEIGYYVFDGTKWLREYESDFVIINKMLYKYIGKQPEVIIPNNVEVIADCSFSDNKYIESVVMSDNVTKIGRYAFSECNNLKKIRLSENIACIKYAAFADCISLESIEIPKSVKEIKTCAFSGCVKLNEVKVHGKLIVDKESFKETGLEFDWIIPLEYDEFNLSYSDENKEYCFAFRSADKSEEYRLNAVKSGHLDGYEVFRDITTGRYGYKNKLGEIVIKPEFFIAYPHNDNGLAVVMTEKEHFGVIDVHGKFVIPAGFIFVKPVFPETIAAVHLCSGWGFIDMNGNNVVTPRFDEVSDCISGYAAVKKDGKWGLIRVNSKKKFTLV